MAKRSSIWIREDQQELIDHIVEVSGSTGEIDVLAQSEVIRLLIDAGIVSLNKGRVSIDGTGLDELLDDEVLYAAFERIEEENPGVANRRTDY